MGGQPRTSVGTSGQAGFDGHFFFGPRVHGGHSCLMKTGTSFVTITSLTTGTGIFVITGVGTGTSSGIGSGTPTGIVCGASTCLPQHRLPQHLGRQHCPLPSTNNAIKARLPAKTTNLKNSELSARGQGFFRCSIDTKFPESTPDFLESGVDFCIAIESFHIKSTSYVMKNFKRVHDSIKPSVWSLCFVEKFV